MKSILNSIIITTLLVFPIGVFVGHFFGSTSIFPQVITRKSEEFAMISPLLECNAYSPTAYKEYSSLKKELQKEIDKKIEENKIERIGIYFQDLTNGSEISLNESEIFEPKSLFKVLTLIDFLYASELQPQILQEKVIYTGTASFSETNIENEEKLEPNNEYTYKQILEQMIIQSDNSAAELIAMKSSEFGLLGRIYDTLGINVQKNEEQKLEITAKEYSRVFRILYNSSYLNEKNSNYALSVLARTTFEFGLKSGIPNSITIAHKFGFSSSQTSPLSQLHDCGIIYHPSRPYVLCIMTEGKTREGIEGTFKDFSAMVYKTVEKIK